MKIVTKKHGNVTIAVVSRGKGCGGDPSLPLGDTLAGIDKCCKPQFLVDLRQVSYLDSAGVGELVSASKTVTNAGGAIKFLMLPDSSLWKLFERTHLNEVFDCYKDEQAALNSF